MSDESPLLTTNRKALTINLDNRKYGTLAEIGAGQEVARHFFQAGGAAGTIARSISAYDMAFSDAIYGKAPRYVSRERLQMMLDCEYDLLNERLSDQRGAESTFFVFADTVSAMSYRGNNECHGWMGMRFQTEPAGEPNEVILHVRMWDKDNLRQQQALGVVGINLIYGAFFHNQDPQQLILSLLDNVGPERMEVDMFKVSGPTFAGVDNRLLSLLLVRQGLTHAVMFGPGKEVLQPSEVLHKKALLVERGRFRPVTHVNVDMINCARARFMQEPEVEDKDVFVLTEITINNLLAKGELDPEDFLNRVDLLGDLGFPVLISSYSEYFRLTTYFRRYTKEMIGVAMGVSHLLEVFNEKYYEDLEGGILENFGRLFRNSVKLYIHPMHPEAYGRSLDQSHPTTTEDPGTSATPEDLLITSHNLPIAKHLRHLYAHLVENHYIEGIAGFDSSILSILPQDVLQRIASNDSTWETMVPKPVVKAIKERELFGYTPTGQ